MAHLYARDGVDVALIGVEVWSSGVIVRLAGLPTEQTEALERTFRDDLERWTQTGRQGQPPRHPAEQLFEVSLALADDVGTNYALQSGVRGGSGRMFRAEWAFEPGPPVSASGLTLLVTEQSDTRASVDIDL
jgi:hypothetical protein